MSKTKRRILSPLTKFKRFMGLFLKNKRGFAGLVIIAGFAIMALGAPLLTPYDPVNDQFISGSYSAPQWLEVLPSALGGMPGAAHNIEIQDNMNFTNGLEGWNYTVDPRISVSYSSDISYDQNGGSARISFSRNETGTTYGMVTASFYKEFYWPYQGQPRKMIGDLDLIANGTTTEIVEKILNETWQQGDRAIFKWINGTIDSGLEANITISAYLQRVYDNTTFILWPRAKMTLYGLRWTGPTGNKNPVPGNIYEVTNLWIESSSWPIDTDLIDYSAGLSNFNATAESGATNATLHTINNMFIEESMPGNYIYGVNVTFNDLYYSDRPVETTLNIDNFGLIFQGRVWGIMGTDYLGRDLWSQLVYGARISLYVGLLASIIGVVIGLIVGLAAGYMGRYVDEFLMRFSDMLLVIPTLPLLIVLVAVLGPALENLIILIGFLGWMGFARVVRSQVLSLRERPFVEAAKAVGAGKTHIMSRHILPNVISLVYVSLATSVPGAIVSEAALSFLGFYDPTKVSWGRMLYDVQATGSAQYWWWVVPPGLCIAALAIAFVLLGFALDEVFNPRLRMRR